MSVTARDMMATQGLSPAHRRLVTPEGVDLGVRLADMGSRFGALTLDMIFMIIILIGMAFLLGSAGLDGSVASIVLILTFFFLRNFYFLAFEMSRRAATPGKRMMKIRVASRTGSRLSASSIFTRNAMREIELFIPLMVLFFGPFLGGGDGSAAVDGWVWLFAFIWASIFAFFPFFNKDRLRVGDLVAGSWVVRSPKPVLLEDLSSGGADRARFAFTPEQIDAYGIKELHVLEDVLRAKDPRIMSEVANRIREKIGWRAGLGENDIEFLTAYYAGLRGRLESGLLMGRRRVDKFDTR